MPENQLYVLMMVFHTLALGIFLKKKNPFKYLRFPNSSHVTKHSSLNYLNNFNYNVQSYPPHYVISCIPLHMIILKYFFLKFYLEIQIKSARIDK